MTVTILHPDRPPAQRDGDAAPSTASKMREIAKRRAETIVAEMLPGVLILIKESAEMGALDLTLDLGSDCPHAVMDRLGCVLEDEHGFSFDYHLPTPTVDWYEGQDADKDDEDSDEEEEAP